MTTGTSPGRPPSTRLHAGKVALVGGGVLLFGLAVASWFYAQRPSPKPAEIGEKGDAYTAAETHYVPVAPKPEPPPPVPVDTISPQLAALRAMLKAMQAELDELKNRKPTQTVVQQPAPPQPKPAPIKPPALPMLFVSHDLKETPPVSKVPLYTLSPGGYIPCEAETKIVSDVPGYFVCRVTTNVYDTALGRHLLVSQGSKVLGHDQANELIYGSERMDTISLTLALSDGRMVDLGRAPITDQQGVAGLTGDVNSHFWRIAGAVLIGGALKGGITAIQIAAANAAGAGQVATGLTSLGNQATTNIVQPYINIRPTITVEAGALANVLLIKPLLLPAMWQ